MDRGGKAWISLYLRARVRGTHASGFGEEASESNPQNTGAGR